MDLLRIKNLKEVTIVDGSDVQEILAFDGQGNLVKVSSGTNLIPVDIEFIDQNGEGQMTVTAKEFEADGFSEVNINASNYGQEKYNSGQNDGYNSGRTDGYNEGYNSGYIDGQVNCSGSTGSNIGSAVIELKKNNFDENTGISNPISASTYGFDGLNNFTIDATWYGSRRYNLGKNEGYSSGYTVGYNEGQANCSGSTGIINMSDIGLRFYRFNGETLDGFDYSGMGEYKNYFYMMPYLKSDINLTFRASQTMQEMFVELSNSTDEGVQITIDCAGYQTFEWTSVFRNCKLKRFPKIINMSEDSVIDGYALMNGSSIVNFDNWNDFPWDKVGGGGGNNLFARMSMTEVPTINLSKVEVANGMFMDCRNLTTVGDLGFSNIGAFSNVFAGCSALTSIGDLGNFENCWQFDTPFDGCPNLVQLPRMHNLKRNLDLSNMVQMDTGVALLFMVYDLYDFTANEVAAGDGEGTLTLPSYFQNDENWEGRKSAIESRGWTIVIAE